MRFVDMEFLVLMLPLSLVLLYLVLTNKSMVERIFDPQVLRRIKLEQGMDRRLRLLSLFIALFFMIVALARPVYEKGVVEVESRRADLVIALDVSRSMQARDLYPNRLEFAKKKIEDLIEASQNLAIGLVAFAKDAFIVSPITSDKETLRYMLRHLDTKALAMPGTNIAAALQSAKLLFGPKRPKNVLLVTDGGDEQDFSELAEYAKSEGFRIFVLGVGSQKGAPIPEGRGYVKDEKGDMVIVRRNDAIAQLAEATGGLYVAATTSDEDIKKLLEAFGAFERSAKVERVADRTELYHYFLAVALLFLFLAFFDIPSKNLAFVLLLVYVPGYSGVLDFRHIKDARDAYKGGHYERAAKEFGRVAEAKKSPEAYYNLGNALYKAGKYKEALEAYGRVETANKELEFRKLHNMGNAAFRLGQYQKAIELYQKALGIKEDPDTRYNLELAKKMLQKKRQQKKEQKDQQQGTKQQRPQDDKSGKQKGKKGQISPQKPKGHKRAPITDREEKKWQKELERTPMKTFLYRAPVKSKKMGESDEKPW